jgi:hypothetical protein
MAILRLVLGYRLFTVLAFPLIGLLCGVISCEAIVKALLRTWNRFLELPGRLNSLFSPTFLDPSLILLELAVKGSGAATFDSFYGELRLSAKEMGKGETMAYRFAFLANHIVVRRRGVL